MFDSRRAWSVSAGTLKTWYLRRSNDK